MPLGSFNTPELLLEALLSWTYFPPWLFYQKSFFGSLAPCGHSYLKFMGQCICLVVTLHLLHTQMLLVKHLAMVVFFRKHP